MLRQQHILTQEANLESPHQVSVQRRTNGTFAPIVDWGKVRPNEAIRLLATGLRYDVKFSIWQSPPGETIFEQTASRALFGDSAWLDIQAPSAKAAYQVTATTLAPLTNWPLTSEFTHFLVAEDAPPPPTEPPATGPSLPGGIADKISDWLKEGRNILILVIVLAVIFYIPKPRR